MTTLSVALLQLAASGYDQEANLAKGDDGCRRAAGLGADIALFPEMWNIGYAFEGGRPASPPAAPLAAPLPAPPDVSTAAAPAAALARWRSQAVPRDGEFVSHFGRLAAELRMAIAITYLERWDGGPRNTVTLFDRRGSEILTYAKVHTCDFDQPEAALTPGDAFPVATLETAAGEVQVGAMICFDREFPETARILALEGAELILVPNACPMEDNRTAQLRVRAFENMVAVACANYPTGEDTDGHSVAFHPCVYGGDGPSRDTRVVGAGEGEEICLARFDLDELRDWRRTEVWGGCYRRPHLYGRLTGETIADVFRRVDDTGRTYDPTDR